MTGFKPQTSGVGSDCSTNCDKNQLGADVKLHCSSICTFNNKARSYKINWMILGF